MPAKVGLDAVGLDGKRIGNRGRKPGSRNRTPAALAKTILDTLAKLNRQSPSKSWLFDLARSRPEVFASLLGRCLPKDVRVEHVGARALPALTEREALLRIEAWARGRLATITDDGTMRQGEGEVIEAQVVPAPQLVQCQLNVPPLPEELAARWPAGTDETGAAHNSAVGGKESGDVIPAGGVEIVVRPRRVPCVEGVSTTRVGASSD